MPQPSYTAYKTPTRYPAMIHYLESQFCKLNLWFDWLVLMGVGHHQVQQIKDHVGVTRTRAERMVWNAFAAAFQADQNTPLFADVNRLMQSISPSEKPLFMAHTMIAVHIHRGLSIEEARLEFIRWLNEDPVHGIFGEYRLTRELTTVPLEGLPKISRPHNRRNP